MAPDRPPAQSTAGSNKRKGAPTQPRNGGSHGNKRPKLDHRAKQRDARQLSTQTTSKAFRNGELDVDKFVRAREFEIRALEEGMQRSKKALNRRAFQQVPKDLRRRTASHNVKKMPKRLQARGKREMLEDNTPTVTARRRKPTRHMRLRMETAKKLRDLGRDTKKRKEKCDSEKVTVKPLADSTATKPVATLAKEQDTSLVKTRTPKIKKTTLAQPPRAKSKFRKRQIHKSWLPTHLFHAKRAHMTPPSAPLWRFSIPLTPTAKCYRPIHRASRDRGAVAWDTSYMSMMALEGQHRSLIGLLRAAGVDEAELSRRKGRKWRDGLRVLEAMAKEREAPHQPVAPVTIIWCALSPGMDCSRPVENDMRKRKLLLCVHPSAFFQLWEEILRLAKVAKPEVMVEDLRFELGSIELKGPGATEALLGALWPSPRKAQIPPQGMDGDILDGMNVDAEAEDTTSNETVGETWQSLAGLTNSSLLPPNALLGFRIQDPRLHHPPRTIKLPTTNEAQNQLLQTLARWPVDSAQGSADLFDRRSRMAAARCLPSQKAINRRKALALPGEYPKPSDKDPEIPVLLYTATARSSTSSGHSNVGWTLLVPWKAVQPIWYSIMYYPLSTGQQPRFGGLDEMRQLSFEAGRPWFPADYPGTKAGWQWEMQERVKRHELWKRRPKSKRVNWETVDISSGKVGEVGIGWACAWERLLPGPPEAEGAVAKDGAADTNHHQMNGVSEDKTDQTKSDAAATKAGLAGMSDKPKTLTHVTSAEAQALLASRQGPDPQSKVDIKHALITVRLALLTRGVPQSCARVYRLPPEATGSELRKKWLALLPSNAPHHATKGPKNGLPQLSKDAPAHEIQRRLAQSLLQPPRAGEEKYPACPGEEDLIGFVTSGNFNLAEGQGTGIGSILIERVLDGWKKDGEEARLCVVRNSGESVGRLARWELA